MIKGSVLGNKRSTVEAENRPDLDKDLEQATTSTTQQQHHKQSYTHLLVANAAAEMVASKRPEHNHTMNSNSININMGQKGTAHLEQASRILPTHSFRLHTFLNAGCEAGRLTFLRVTATPQNLQHSITQAE